MDWEYFAGFFDGEASIGLYLSKIDSTNTGWKIQPQINISQSNPPEEFVDNLKSILDSESISYSIQYRKNIGKFDLRIQSRKSILKLYDKIGDRVIDKKEQFDILAKDIIPALNDRVHTSKSGILKVIVMKEELDKNKSKIAEDQREHTVQFFEEEFELTQNFYYDAPQSDKKTSITPEYFAGLFDAEGSVGLNIYETKNQIKKHTIIALTQYCSEKFCNLLISFLVENGINAKSTQYEQDYKFDRYLIRIQSRDSASKMYELLNDKIVLKLREFQILCDHIFPILNSGIDDEKEMFKILELKEKMDSYKSRSSSTQRKYDIDYFRENDSWTTKI